MLKKFQCLFSITLLLAFCPTIFTKSSNVQEQATPAHQLQKEHEIFQHFMSQAREQTQTIGWSIQQLFQTINAGKLKLTPEQKKQVIEELSQIQEFTNMMIEQLFVQTTQEALCQGILINHILITYLIQTLSTDFTKVQASAFMNQLSKQSGSPIKEESILHLAEINQEKINDLVTLTEHVGLHWYNHFYRTMKKYNAFMIAKGVSIAAATAIATGYILCQCEIETNNSWYNDWIGQRPHEWREGGYYVYKTTPNEKGISTKQAENIKTFTPFQKLSMISDNLQKAGIITVGALLAINLKDVFSWMYKDSYAWMKEKSGKTLKDYDQKLQGTAKQNVSKNGYEKVYFKDMVGCEELETLAKKIANFMKHPERYERAQIEEHRGILLFGPPQTGKTLFAKALRTLIEDEFGDDKELHFIDAKALRDIHGWTIEYIFWYASFYAPCIIFFDEIDLIGTNRDKSPEQTAQLLTCMQGVDMTTKQMIVIGATNRPEQLDTALLVDGRFGKIIHIEYPKYNDRKIYLEQQLAKRCINLSPEYIDYIAQETEGCSYNNLKRIITEAYILSSIETRQVTQQDFEKTLDAEVRKIQPAKTMSDGERKIVATYQAGKAVARHILQTMQEVVKITINPVIKEVKTTNVGLVIDSKAEKSSENDKLIDNKKEQRVKLGEVFTKCTANHSELLSNTEQEKECMALLAGSAALQLLLNDSYSQCNKQDRAEVMHIIYNMISNGEKIDDKLKAQAVAIKEKYEKQIFALLQQHKPLLEKVVAELILNTTIDRYTWKSLIS
ncbi:AAA family ATPase [Candidatus Babeliales bacterium]|nr:AAA family ATPase [Candidatus Babeliales bacterium]